MWELSALQLANVVLILFAAGMLQSTIGFAAGVFGIPLLLLAGISLPESVGISLLHSLLHCSIGSYTLRKDIEFRDTLLPLILRVGMLPVGMWSMWYVGSVDQGQVKQIVGSILLIILVVMWRVRVTPRNVLPRRWTILSFVISGYLAGFCGMGGAFMALWVMAHDWSTRRSRGFMMFMFLVTLTPQAIGMLFIFPEKSVAAYQLGIVLLPVALTGTWLGLTIGNRLPRNSLRCLVYGVLLMIALWSIVSPFL